MPKRVVRAIAAEPVSRSASRSTSQPTNRVDEEALKHGCAVIESGHSVLVIEEAGSRVDNLAVSVCDRAVYQARNEQ